MKKVEGMKDQLEKLKEQVLKLSVRMTELEIENEKYKCCETCSYAIDGFTKCVRCKRLKGPEIGTEDNWKFAFDKKCINPKR